MYSNKTIQGLPVNFSRLRLHCAEKLFVVENCLTKRFYSKAEGIDNRKE